MAQFKRFNASENDNWNTNDAYPQGTLTWDPDNGLRIHDGSTSGGNSVGGSGASTGNTTFSGNGIGNSDNGTVNDMIIAPNWDGQFTGNTYINLRSNDNAGSAVEVVNNSSGGVCIITQNNATWAFGADGNLTAPGNILSTSGTFTTSGDNDIVIRAEKGLGAPGGPGFVDWTFGVLGDLTLPEGGDILDSNGNSVLGGNANTGNVLFDSETLYVNNGSTNTGYLNLENDLGNLVIGTNTDAAVRISVNGNNTEKGWVFGTDGSITFPDLSIQTTAYTGGGGTSLPLDAAGVLKNDGTGTLSWSSLDIQDLTDNGNLLNFTQQQADWEEMNAASPAYIQNKPMLVTSYNELTDKPDLFNGDYLSLTGTPSLANVATTGMYGDLTGTPTSLSDFTNDPGFISASDLAVSSGGSGSLSYSNGLFTYEGPTVPTDISELTDNTNLLSSGGGTTLPADASGYLNNNGSGTLTWVAGNPTGSGMLPYNGVTVLSNTVVGDWTEYTLSGTMDAFYDWNNNYTTITLSSQTAYGKEITVNTKNLWINDSKINSNDYLVIAFPSTPSVGDVFSVPVVNTLTTVNAGSFVVGETYTIVSAGTTNWVSIGAQYAGTGQSFVATGAGSGTGTATTAAGAKKLIFKPASGHRAHTMAQGNLGPIAFGQGGTYDFMYIDLSGLNAGNPITWVYAGLIGGVPSWYQFYF